MKMKEKEKIIIFDTTLRDGEQARGCSMTPLEKLVIAKQLKKLGVDVIEAGFAISSPAAEQAIHRIATEVGTKDGPIITSLARVIKEDIDVAARAIKPAYHQRIHVFIATSDEHVKHKFAKDPAWVLDQIKFGVSYAKKYVDDVEFSCEDFARTDINFTIEAVIEAIKNGATTINLPDTVGYSLPGESYSRVKKVIDTVRKKGHDAVFSVHNHDDLGMATANTIVGVQAGARQVEVTINSIGERAGNTSLEQVVAAIHTRDIGTTNINREYIAESSKIVSKITGIIIPPNTPIVGSNAFSHEAGIHQDGMIKNANTYEIMNPESYGMESVITLGPRSGSRAVRAKYIEMGYDLNEEEFAAAFKSFINIADARKEIDDADVIRSLQEDTVPRYIKLKTYLQKESKDGFENLVELTVNNKLVKRTSKGVGLIHAGINAITSVIGEEYKFSDYEIVANDHGSKAQGQARLKINAGGYEVIGSAVSPDVVSSSFQAYIDGVNRLRYCMNSNK